MAHHKHLHRRQHGGDHNSHLILSRDSKDKDKDTNPEQGSPKVATIVSVVYVTAAPTFNGPIGGYTTLAPVGAPLQASSAKSPPPIAAPSSSPAKAPSSVIPPPSIQPTTAPSDIPASADPSSVAPSSALSSSVAIDSSLAPSSSIAIDSPVLSSAASSTAPLTTPLQKTSSTPLSSDISSSSLAAASATASPSASPTTTSATTSGGVSGGAKAGLAFGLLVGIGAVLALVLICYRRKKKQNKSYEKTDDEKSAFNSDSVTFGAARPPSTGTTRTSATAPRLNLRPVTQFYPDLGERRKSGNLLASTPAVTGPPGPSLNVSAAELPSSSESQVGRSPGSSNGSSNPFGDHAENPTPALQAGSLPAASLAPGTQAATPGIVENPHSKGVAVAGGAVAAGVPASHQHAPKPLYINSNSSTPTAPVPSPARTEFSVNSITPDTAPAVAPHSSNVHRVQLDFRPSMDDELELRAGQLVRLLHEYDDGWALCIRLDRSQQGVAPRTCLSTRPVKPRPAGTGAPRGAPPPNLRKPPIQSAAGASVPRSMSPASGRNSPGPGLYNQSPRPMSPGPFAQQPRSMSPGPYGGGPQRPPTSPGGRNRSNSASQVRDRRNSPPGPSPMNPNAKAQQRLPVQLTAGSPQPQASPPTSMPRKPVPGQAI